MTDLSSQNKKLRITPIIAFALLAMMGASLMALVRANPTFITDRLSHKELDKYAASNSNWERSREEDLASGDNSREDAASTEDDNSGEIDAFSGKLVTVENDTAIVTNVQKWEIRKPGSPANKQGMEMYFLDDQGDQIDVGTNVTRVAVVLGNIACNNGKDQYFQESERCNGVYQCDDNSEDERNCSSKCLGAASLGDQCSMRAHQERFYYDIASATCHLFIYNGCANRVNMFLSKTECERECQGVTLTTTTTTTTTAPTTQAYVTEAQAVEEVSQVKVVKVSSEQAGTRTLVGSEDLLVVADENEAALSTSQSASELVEISVLASGSGDVDEVTTPSSATIFAAMSIDA